MPPGDQPQGNPSTEKAAPQLIPKNNRPPPNATEAGGLSGQPISGKEYTRSGPPPKLSTSAGDTHGRANLPGPSKNAGASKQSNGSSVFSSPKTNPAIPPTQDTGISSDRKGPLGEKKPAPSVPQAEPVHSSQASAGRKANGGFFRIFGGNDKTQDPSPSKNIPNLPPQKNPPMSGPPPTNFNKPGNLRQGSGLARRTEAVQKPNTNQLRFLVNGKPI